MSFLCFCPHRQESLAQAAAPGNKDVAAPPENWGEEMTTTDWANEPAPAGAAQAAAAAAGQPAMPAQQQQKFQVNDDWSNQVGRGGRLQ